MKNKLFTFIVGACMVMTMLPVFVSAQTPGPEFSMHGWTWSPTIGWIKLSSKRLDSAGLPLTTNDNSVSYGVDITTGGIASGWAWSPNIGWISFNAADLALPPSCLGPGSTPATGARLVADGTGYKLVGTARVISPTQAPWSASTAHGNWSGCIYFDSTNLPMNPCSTAFTTRFNPQADGVTFLGVGSGWNAGGAITGSTSCAGLAGLGFGGLSFVDFGGSFKAVLRRNTVNLDATLASSGWNPVCRLPDGSSLGTQNVTVNYTLTYATGTVCTWYRNGVAVGNETPIATSGSEVFAIAPSSTGVSIQLRCHNPASAAYPTASSPLIRTLPQPFVCTQCSDGVDNTDPEDSDADEADLACRAGCAITGAYLPQTPNETAGIGGNVNCAAGTKLKGIPVLKEN